MFQPHQLIVTVDVLSKLTPQHMDIISLLGVISMLFSFVVVKGA